MSDGELLAALAATRGQDGAAGPGTHPLAEAVDLRPPAVVRLERTLAHWNSRSLGKLSSVKGRHVVRRALQTWLSLLTVRAIPPQVKLNRPGPANTGISTTYPPPAT